MNDRQSFIKSSFAKIGKYKIHYLEAGKGKPVVLIHGWLAWGGNWDKIIFRLKDKYHVYAVDLIGHGLSDKPAEINYYKTDKQAEMISSFIKDVVKEPAYLTGHSMGGEISAKVAMSSPALIKKLIMVSAVGLKKNPDIIPFLPRMGLATGAVHLVPALCSNWSINWVIRDYMYYEKNPVDEFTAQQIINYSFGNDKAREGFVNVTTTGLFQDFIDDKVKDIKVPVLLVWGRDDLVVPLELGEDYEKIIPGSRLFVIPEAGHMVFEEKPDIFVKELCDFISN